MRQEAGQLEFLLHLVENAPALYKKYRLMSSSWEIQLYKLYIVYTKIGQSVLGLYMILLNFLQIFYAFNIIFRRFENLTGFLLKDHI
jgi:hypothetical protein